MLVDDLGGGAELLLQFLEDDLEFDVLPIVGLDEDELALLDQGFELAESHLQDRLVGAEDVPGVDGEEAAQLLFLLLV